MRKLYATVITVIVTATTVAQASERSFYVVLGSYLSRDIALRELVEFSDCRAPLMVMQQPRDGQTYYRVQHGPLVVQAEAQALVNAWAQCGLDEAWVVRYDKPLPELFSN